MKIWAKTSDFSEGKFLVVRRDSSIPAWPHFVLGARDPAAPSALRAYAIDAEWRGMDKEFVASIRELACDFEAYRKEHGDGDPDAPPHRTDDPAVLAAMRHGLCSHIGLTVRPDRFNVKKAPQHPEAEQPVIRKHVGPLTITHGGREITIPPGTTVTFKPDGSFVITLAKAVE